MHIALLEASNPDLLTRKFCGQPLIYWSLMALEKSKTIRYIVAGAAFEKFEPITELSLNKLVIADFLPDEAKLQCADGEVIDLSDETAVFRVNLNNPFVRATDFDQAWNYFDSNSELRFLISAFINNQTTIIETDFINSNNVLNTSFNLIDFEDIQSLSKLRKEQIGVYQLPSFFRFLPADEYWSQTEDLMRKYILKINASKPIKLFLTDVDGTLTDAGMYYSEGGEELKKFNTHDGMGLKLLQKKGIKVGIITSENTKMVENRGKKLGVDFVYQDARHKGKLEGAKKICEQEKISLEEVAYIGDDINCYELLEAVGLAACPSNSQPEIKSIVNIIHLEKAGGDGAVREFINKILKDS